MNTSTLSYDINEEDHPLPVPQPKEVVNNNNNKNNNTNINTKTNINSPVIPPKIESSPVKHVPHLVKSTDPIQGNKLNNINDAKVEAKPAVVTNSQPGV